MKKSLPSWLPDRLLTVDETAVLLQLSKRHVRRLIATGRLSSVRLGRAVRLRPEAIVALIDNPN